MTMIPALTADYPADAAFPRNPRIPARIHGEDCIVGLRLRHMASVSAARGTYTQVPVRPASIGRVP